MAHVIIYYIVSPVHLHNVRLIAHELLDWRFRLVYEASNLWLSDDILSEFQYEKVQLINNDIPAEVWAGDVRAVIFSTAQPHPAPINLLQAAMSRDIPTIAIEESNQIALNGRMVNNYDLPVDYVLAASDYERDGLISAGAPARRIEVTGWPFYSGSIGKTDPECAKEMKAKLGLDPNRPVASLTLTGLNTAGENPQIRHHLLSLAAAGLPPEYQLVVKPHPIEPLSSLLPFLSLSAPDATPVSGSISIHDLLRATDVLLNRGVSQVCIEALYKKIPVIVLEAGRSTPFHNLTPEIIVNDPGEIVEVLDKLSACDLMQVYQPFINVHMPFSSLLARAQTCDRIREIAEIGSHDPERPNQWLELILYYVWHTDPRLALNVLTEIEAMKTANRLRRLINHETTRDDLEFLKETVGSGFLSYALRCWWIEQLDRRRERSNETDLEWMQDFPPSVNTWMFVAHISRWSRVLLRSGQLSAALALVQRLERDFMDVTGVPDLIRDIDLYNSGRAGRVRYFFRRAVRASNQVLWPYKNRLKQFLYAKQ